MLLAALTAVVAAVSPATPTGALTRARCETRSRLTASWHTRTLCVQHRANANGGTRAAGTPGYDALLAYVQAQLEATPYSDVTVQRFTFDRSASSHRRCSSGSRPIRGPSSGRRFHHDGLLRHRRRGGASGRRTTSSSRRERRRRRRTVAASRPITPASATEPQVALIQRGTCDFHIKAENAQAVGYDAKIIFNRVSRAVTRRSRERSPRTISR